MCAGWGFLGSGVAVLKRSVKPRRVDQLAFKAHFYELEKTCAASMGSLMPAQTRSPDACPSKLPPRNAATSAGALHMAGHSVDPLATASVEGTHHSSLVFSPQSLCQGTREDAPLWERRGKNGDSNFRKSMWSGAAVGWLGKGWRAEKSSSLGQMVQEKGPRKSFLGNFHECLRHAKPNQDVRPQLYV